jgi:hypothetical protein
MQTSVFLLEDVTMEGNSFIAATGFGVGLTILVAASDAKAAEAVISSYQGAWLAGGSDCAEIYSSTGKETAFKKPVDIFAPAFIIFGNRLMTPQATCQIKSVRQTGNRQRFILSCANAVAGSEVRVLMATQPDGSLKRYFNEEDMVGTEYKRCSR